MEPKKVNTNLTNKKLDDLQANKESAEGEFMTTDHATRINDDQNSLKAGDRGPTLMEYHDVPNHWHN